jgi:hypothetical protein
LTPGERKKDIQYIAQWAKDYSPFVELNERVKGCPSYESLKPKYIELAEKAQNNEEFLQVVYGYFNLIGDSGHFYLIPEDYLRGYLLVYLVSKNPTEISWIQFHEASYWAKLFDQKIASVRPPFRIRNNPGRWPSHFDNNLIKPLMVRLPESGMIFVLEADLLINPDGSYNEISGTKPDIELLPGDLPTSVTKEELLKDKWIEKIMTEL